MKRARDPEALRRIIRARGLSYRQLGGAVGCSHTTLYLLLQGKATSDKTANGVAKILDNTVDPDVFFVDAVSSTEHDLSKQEAVA
jgi:transcriptional regulator with XRE-family HTH domain